MTHQGFGLDYRGKVNGTETNLYRYVENDPIQYTDPNGKNKFKESWERIKRCKRAVDAYLDQKTCDAAKEINKDYQCQEWDDNLKEILDPRHYYTPDDGNDGDGGSSRRSNELA